MSVSQKWIYENYQVKQTNEQWNQKKNNNNNNNKNKKKERKENSCLLSMIKLPLLFDYLLLNSFQVSETLLVINFIMFDVDNLTLIIFFQTRSMQSQEFQGSTSEYLPTPLSKGSSFDEQKVMALLSMYTASV